MCNILFDVLLDILCCKYLTLECCILMLRVGIVSDIFSMFSLLIKTVFLPH